MRGNYGVMDGFLGPDHYRFAMIFNKVTRDPAHPEVYYIAGKCKYRRFVTPVTGVMIVRQLLDMHRLLARC